MIPLWLDPAPLILASRSAIRATILAGTGLPIETRPSAVDERALEAGLNHAAPASVARALAEAKALDVSAGAPGRLVVGADQTLALGTERFSKPIDRAAGRAQLVRLSGRTHALASGYALARDGSVLASGVCEAQMTLRLLSDGFLDAYLDLAGDGMLASVGGYQFEGLGAHLFARVEGDTFTILGLPLLPLLEALRRAGALRA